MAYPRRDIAKTCGTVAVTATSAVVVPNNPARLSLLVSNNSGATVYLKLATQPPTTLGGAPTSPVATADSGSLKLADGQTFATTDYTGPVAMIAGGAASVTVVEF